MNNIKISGLPESTSPNISGFTTVLDGNTTYKTSLQSLKNTIGGYLSVQETSISFINGSIWGTADLTPFIDLHGDDNYYEITLPWTVTFLGQQYDKVYLGSNSYLTFGAGSGIYNPIYPGRIPVPAIFVGAGDNGISNYYTGTILNGNQTEFRIRYEGWNETNGNVTAYTQVWEAVFVSGVTDEIRIIMGQTLRNPGGTWGLSDGSRWIEEFNGLPFFDAKRNSTYNGLLISPISTADTNELKITGPGVTTDVNGDVVYVNIDPLGQAGIGVSYDISIDGGSIIASKRFNLLLTTGENGSSINIQPNGDVNIQPKSIPTGIDPTDGWDINLSTPDGSDSGDGYSVRRGGDVTVNTGNGIHNGRNGRMNINCDIEHSGVINGVKKYTALLTQNSVTITGGTLTIGEKYVITDYNCCDDFTNVAQVLSGSTINQNGCIFIATGTTPTSWFSGSTLTIVSLSAPIATVLENTLGFTPQWEYITTGIYGFSEPGAFPITKTFVYTPISFNNITGPALKIYDNTSFPNSFVIFSDFIGNGDNSFHYTPLEIKVYP
jgi:hypothetical protein